MARITSEYQDTSIEAVNEGPYRAKVKKVALQPLKPGKQWQSIRVDLGLVLPHDQAGKALADGSYPLIDFISLAPQAGWKLEEFLSACGGVAGVNYHKKVVSEKKFTLEWDTVEFEGRELMALVSVGPERNSDGSPKVGGRIMNQVESYTKL